MKSKNEFLHFLCFAVIFALTLASCSTSRKSAIACPEFNKYPSKKVTLEYKKNKNPKLQSKKQHSVFTKRNHTKHTSSIKNLSGSKIQPPVSSYFKSSDFSAKLIASTDNTILPLIRFNSDILEKFDPTGLQNPLNKQNVCDTILLKSGVALIGKVEEINQKEIRYRKCNNLNGPMISILKSDVKRIDYANDTHEVLAGDAADINDDVFIHDTDVFTQENAPIVKTDGLAVAGFASSVIGLLIAGVILGTIGIIFGSISLRNINRNKGRVKGRGLAVASIIIGFIAVIGALIVISAM